uniref:CDP-diacylglycerol--serine O-phosphatidyltransferase n=1 Tax=Candidatus Kentrum sp. SD TaxID=2126332 RepID=A0A451BJH4_9GAMM|nr:MAG: CDP-diacylglycerol---serine O-phosphatidyltransferase [Candidatus Kentron sp. SD]VFK40520.1 MAG: CDP-diacylglycerol---serine O-phosphatidyltransferase [Candidatus Kentron sp. SD]VFK78368.1 MAG: CDP-diacylglycerol---serine O-phosphatidyltransferase [Candidatus Kentron sp. SD]
MSNQSSLSKRRRGIFLLPNLFTTAALFAGFYSIVAAMGGRFETAAMAIVVAIILDGVDGRIARITNTESAFGAAYDSLSDMVAFGLAPALLAYEWSLVSLGKLGWLVAFVFTASAALRLARFTVQVDVADKRYFQGLPSPSGAALLSVLVWLGVDYGVSGEDAAMFVSLGTILTGILMVSNIRYHSLKGFDPKGKVPFISALAIVLVFVMISIDPPLVLFGGFLIYAISGPVLTLFHVRKRREARKGVADILPKKPWE